MRSTRAPALFHRRPLRAARAAAGALAAALLLACGDSTGPGDGDAITTLPRELSAAEVEIVSRSGGFGLDLMARVAATDERDNLVLSPLSASMALGMTLNGTAGTTFDGMRTALGFDGLSQSEINDGYRDLIDLLTDLDPAVTFGIGNAVWANEEFPFHASFFDTVTAAFDAAVETADFAAPSTLDAINGWVDDATEGFIPVLLSELDPDLKMILLNAIYLDASWTESFDPADTRSSSFRRADGSDVTVDLMTRTEVELPYAATNEYVAVELPYGGGAFAMLVLVPHSSLDVRTVIQGFDAAAWNALVADLDPLTLDLVSLPKFTVAHDAFLNPVLADMGMAEAFTADADFTNLSPEGDHLCIDFVRQKTFIEVDELGTKAAAATAVGIGPDSFLGVEANRPFFFAIRERLSGTLLFTGIIGDPTLEDAGPQEGEGMCH